MEPKFPHIRVRLLGEDGNAFHLIGITRSAMRAAGVPSEEIEAFTTEAQSGDYDHVLRTIMNTVTVFTGDDNQISEDMEPLVDRLTFTAREAEERIRILANMIERALEGCLDPVDEDEIVIQDEHDAIDRWLNDDYLGQPRMHVDHELVNEASDLLGIREDNTIAWEAGGVFVREDNLPTVAQDRAADIHGLSFAGWPFDHIDWEGATEELKDLYESESINGEAFFFKGPDE